MSRFARAMGIALLPLAVCVPQAHADTALTLAQAVQRALAHNHDARLADIAVASADAATTQAKAAPNPTLSVQTANINPAEGVGPGGLRSKTVDTTFQIQQLIERGGKRALRGEAADKLARAVRSDAADTRRQLRRDVSQAYFDLLAAQERVAILNELAQLSDGTLGAAEKRQKAGDLAAADVARLRIDTLRAHNDAEGAVADLAQAQRTLELLLGHDGGEIPVATDPWPTTAPAPAASAVDGRADVLAAKARADAAIASRRLAQAGRTRDLTVGVQFEHYPVSATNQLGSGNSVGISVQVPLFVRYNNEGEIRAAEAAVDAADESLLRARQQARADVEKAAADMRSAAARSERFEHDILPAARKASDAGEFAFTHGASGVMDVLDVRRSYRSAQLDALAARADFAKSVAAFDAATTEESKE